MKLLNKFLKKTIVVKGTVEYHATSALTVGHRHILPGDKIIYAEVTKTFTINRFQRGPIEVDIVAELLYPLNEEYFNAGN